MAKKFEILWNKMSPECQADSAQRASEMLAVMDLAELRKARDLSQGELAERLQRQQPAVAKIEGREDLHISTVREYVEALGGRLDLVVHLPQGESILLKSLSSKTD